MRASLISQFGGPEQLQLEQNWNKSKHPNPRAAGINFSNVYIRRGRTREETRSAAASEHLLQTLWSGPTQVLQKRDEIDIVGHRVAMREIRFWS